MTEFNIIEKQVEDGILVEVFYKDNKQGELLYNDDQVSLGIVQYIQTGRGIITLRSFVPESEFSEYNIALQLCNYINDRGGVDEIISPEFFGHRSYRAMRKAEKYENMDRNELIEDTEVYTTLLTNCKY